MSQGFSSGSHIIVLRPTLNKKMEHRYFRLNRRDKASNMKQIIRIILLVTVHHSCYAQLYYKGSNIGNIESDGNVYVRGSRVGKIELDGDIYVNGSRKAKYEDDGDVYLRGSRIGEIESDGDIYLNGSRIGKVEDIHIQQ